jgi:anti-sigma factor RsiW
MKCAEARPLFPAYVDNAVTGAEMQALSEHMSACPECRTDYRALENTRVLVASLGRKPAPADLALKIRVALSHERSRTWRRFLQTYMVRLEDLMNAFMFPATAGILTTVIFFGAVAGFFVAKQAGAGDLVPGLSAPARLQTTWPFAADLNLEAPVVIQAYVDVSGRVQNYDILSGPDNEGVRSQLNRALLFTKFSPAYAFGQPVAGTAIIYFSHVNVKG